MNRYKNFKKYGLLFFSALLLTGCSNRPYIGPNGNWWIKGDDTGISATGPKGDKGDKGETGDSVSVVSLEKIESINNTDTYLITFSNGTSTTFSVNNGKNLTIISFTKVNSTTKEDVYRITYSDGTTSEFNVTHGSVPEIGDNGNWFINGLDSGILADASKLEDREISIFQKICSSFLNYKIVTFNGETGFFLNDLEYDNIYGKYAFFSDEISFQEYSKYIKELDEGERKWEFVIPNYINNIPVIGVSSWAIADRDYIKSISLSKNTKYIDGFSFYNLEGIETFDFNDSKIIYVGSSAFEGTNLYNSNIPNTIEYVDDWAFCYSSIKEFDFTNTKHIGAHAFESLQSVAFLPKTVEFVGENAFDDNMVYIEEECKPENWEAFYYSYNEDNLKDVFGMKKNNDFIYKIKDNSISIYVYTGHEKHLTIPSVIDNLPVERIEGYFLSDLRDTYWDIEDGTYFNNYDGIFDITISSNVKYIGENALRNGMINFFFEDGFDEVSNLIGEDFFGASFGFKVYENSENLKIKVDDNFLTYNEYKDYMKEYGYNDRTFADISLDNIYFDEETKTYFEMKENECSAIACIDYCSELIVIPDEVKGLPLTYLYEYSYASMYVIKYVVGKNIKELSNACFDCSNFNHLYNYVTRIFIYNTLEKIDISMIHSSIDRLEIYTDSTLIKDDLVFENDSNLAIYYYTDYSIDLFKTINFDGFISYIYEDEKISLINYYDFGQEMEYIEIPRQIKNVEVSKICSNFIHFTQDINCFVYIPSNIEVIESGAFINETSKQILLRFEKNEEEIIVPDDICIYEGEGEIAEPCYLQFGVSFTY